MCALIHSVDSIRLLEAIDAAAAKHELTAHCLLEANISGEVAKHGFQKLELEAALEALDGAEITESPGVFIDTQTIYIPLDNTAYMLAPNTGSLIVSGPPGTPDTSIGGALGGREPR